VRELDAVLAATARVDPEPGLRLWAMEEVLGKRSDRAPALTEETVQRALEAANGNVSAAAAELGVSRGRLLRFKRRGDK
jgi:transcriptional regulator of acetoin/glycerol metabolism